MNPYEVLDLDANADAATLTQALRAAATEETEVAKKQALAELWEEVTQNPAKRLEYALLAGPDCRVCKPKDAHAAAPLSSGAKRTRRRKAGNTDERGALAAELVPLPSLRAIIAPALLEAGFEIQALPLTFGPAAARIADWDADPVLVALAAGDAS